MSHAELHILHNAQRPWLKYELEAKSREAISVRWGCIFLIWLLRDSPSSRTHKGAIMTRKGLRVMNTNSNPSSGIYRLYNSGHSCSVPQFLH